MLSMSRVTDGMGNCILLMTWEWSEKLILNTSFVLFFYCGYLSYSAIYLQFIPHRKQTCHKLGIAPMIAASSIEMNE